jgi:hypothetical protein
MKRLVISSTIAALITGGAGFAFAGQPGPNDHNNHGLCTAYFAGSDTGQAHKHQAPPFAALEQAASDQNETVADYCSTVTPGGK